MAVDGAGLITEKINENKDETLSNATITSIKTIDDIVSFKISQHLYPLLKPFCNIPRKGTCSSKL